MCVEVMDLAGCYVLTSCGFQIEWVPPREDGDVQAWLGLCQSGQVHGTAIPGQLVQCQLGYHGNPLALRMLWLSFFSQLWYITVWVIIDSFDRWLHFSNYCCFSLVFDRYKSYSPYDMLESIKKEVKGDLENAFLNLGE